MHRCRCSASPNLSRQSLSKCSSCPAAEDHQETLQTTQKIGNKKKQPKSSWERGRNRQGTCLRFPSVEFRNEDVHSQIWRFRYLLVVVRVCSVHAVLLVSICRYRKGKSVGPLLFIWTMSLFPRLLPHEQSPESHIVQSCRKKLRMHRCTTSHCFKRTRCFPHPHYLWYKCSFNQMFSCREG